MIPTTSIYFTIQPEKITTTIPAIVLPLPTPAPSPDKQHKCYQVTLNNASNTSRYTVVCRVAQEASPLSILTGRTIMRFLRIRNFMLVLRSRTIFAVEMPSTVSTLHSKFQLNCTRHF